MGRSSPVQDDKAGDRHENISLSPDRRNVRFSLNNQQVNDNNLQLIGTSENNSNTKERMSAPSA